jgi:hypothetical protein
MIRMRSARLTLPALLLALVGVAAGCSDPVEPDAALAPDAPVLASANACWGQASRVFAQTGAMGEHSSQQPTPRAGLANLARALYAQGLIAAPTMQALGAFVSNSLGLSIEACMD